MRSSGSKLMGPDQPRDEKGRWVALRPKNGLSVIFGVAAPNPNLQQVKVVAVCTCGAEVFTYVRKDDASLVAPLDNPWLHEKTFKSACSGGEWPLYNESVIETRHIEVAQ